MKKIEINQEHVNHVLKNTKAEKCLVTADGQIFEMKSISACKDYCNKKGIAFIEANEKGAIGESIDLDKEAGDDSPKKVIPLAKKTKAELTDIAVALGIELNEETNKEIVALIEEAQKAKLEAETSGEQK